MFNGVQAGIVQWIISSKQLARTNLIELIGLAVDGVVVVVVVVTCNANNAQRPSLVVVVEIARKLRNWSRSED